MATGSYDANGIWQYGEDDNIALFSDTLNKLADSTSDAFTSDRSRISTLEAGSLSGLIPVKAASVTIASGTGSANTLGTITFTNATSVSLNQVFTSQYRNYHVELNVTTVSAGCDLNMRLRNAGADVTGTNYYTGLVVIKAASTASYGVTAGDHWFLTNMNQTSLPKGARGSFDIQNPYLVLDSTIQSQFAHHFSGRATDVGGGSHDWDMSQDGFTIYTSTGNMTGVMTVYGYND